FSLAGIWSEWEDPQTGSTIGTYSVLTTRANPLMEKIHNSKKRMPVILPAAYERDWLNPHLTKDDVLALCQPYDDTHMEAWTISRRITDRTSPKNTEEITAPFVYPEVDARFEAKKR
ncbi:MAG: SOS response-associated peptidase family protein, partial [Bacteroidota bacterium]